MGRRIAGCCFAAAACCHAFVDWPVDILSAFRNKRDGVKPIAERDLSPSF